MSQLLSLEKSVDNLQINGLRFTKINLKGWVLLEIGKTIIQL